MNRINLLLYLNRNKRFTERENSSMRVLFSGCLLLFVVVITNFPPPTWSYSYYHANNHYYHDNGHHYDNYGHSHGHGHRHTHSHSHHNHDYDWHGYGYEHDYDHDHGSHNGGHFYNDNNKNDKTLSSSTHLRTDPGFKVSQTQAHESMLINNRSDIDQSIITNTPTTSTIVLPSNNGGRPRRSIYNNINDKHSLSSLLIMANALPGTGGSGSSSLRRISYPPLLTSSRTSMSNNDGKSHNKFPQSWIQQTDQLSPEYSQFRRISCKIKKLHPAQMSTIESLILSSSDLPPNENPVILCNKKRLEKYKDTAVVKTNKEWNVEKIKAQCLYPERWLEFEHCVLEKFKTESEYQRYQDILNQAKIVLENPDKYH